MTVKFVIPTTERQKYVLGMLMRAKVPMADKTDHLVDPPQWCGWMAVTLEKRGNFWYANGKRISRNFAREIWCSGLAK